MADKCHGLGCRAELPQGVSGHTGTRCAALVISGRQPAQVKQGLAAADSTERVPPTLDRCWVKAEPGRRPPARGYPALRLAC